MALFGTGQTFATFGDWQASTPRAGDNPGDNWDGDFFDDLMEYALGSDPRSGQPVIATNPSERAGLKLSVSPSGSVTASVWRPAGRTDIAYSLERSTNLVQWYTVAGQAISASGGGEIVSWAEVNLGKPTGFVRLRITLPGTPSWISRSPPLGWAPVSFATGTQSYGLTLLSDQLYASTVYSTGSSYITVPPSETRDLRAILSSGRPAFVEFSDASPHLEGHRIEINVPGMASSLDPRRIILDLTSTRNTTTSIPSPLAGARFVIRFHDNLGETFPKEYFKGSTSPATADTVRLWTGTGWQNHWLLDERPINPAGRHQWVRSGDATLADQGSLTLPPASGAFLIRRGATTVTLLETGDLRAWHLRRVLPMGTHFLAGSYPLDQTANGLGLSTTGFLPSASPAAAAQFQIWQGDVSTSTPAYSTAWRYTGLDTPYWVLTNDATLSDVSDVPLFRASRAHFATPKQAVNDLAPFPTAVSTFPLSGNPMLDSDSDGLPDSWEIRYYGSITVISGSDDFDGDFFTASDEFFALTSPLLADSDGDGWDDGQEVDIGADPKSDDSTPLTIRPALETEAVFVQFARTNYEDVFWALEFRPKVELLTPQFVKWRVATTLRDEMNEPLPEFPGFNGSPVSGTGELEYPEQAVPSPSQLDQVAWPTGTQTFNEQLGSWIQPTERLLADSYVAEPWLFGDNENFTTYQHDSRLDIQWLSFRLASTVRFPYPISVPYIAGLFDPDAQPDPQAPPVFFKKVQAVTLDLPAGKTTGPTHAIFPGLIGYYGLNLYPIIPTGPLPMESAPDVLRVNTDFDEGKLVEGFAVPDSNEANPDQPSLRAERNSLDGRFKAGELITDDLHEGFFGLRPGSMPADFFDGAEVFIAKQEKTDENTGRPESGVVRLHATRGTGTTAQYWNIPVGGPESGTLQNLVPLLYGSTSLIPIDGVSYWIEGVTGGRITLEFYYKKGSVEYSHKQGYLVCTQQTKAQWRQEIVDQIKLQTSGVEDLSAFVPTNEFNSNVPHIKAVYGFYEQLFVEKPEKLMWAGMAKLAGAPVFAGLSDAQWGRDASLGAIDWIASVKDFQSHLMRGNRVIFDDLGWQHRAFVASGIYALQHVNDADPAVVTLPVNINAWDQIEEGMPPGRDPALIKGGSLALLAREQEFIIQPIYDAIKLINIPFTALGYDDALSVMAENPIPGGRPFADLVTGNLAVFADRWSWIDGGSEEMFQIWVGDSHVGLSAAERLYHVKTSLSNRAKGYANFRASVP